MARRRREQTIFFPWERRRGLPMLSWARSKPVLGGLLLLVCLVLLSMRDRERIGVRSTRATMLVVREAIDGYRADHKKACPPSLAALKEQGYMQVDPVDAWGRPLQLTCPGRRNPESYDLVSFGPSGDMRGLDRVE